MLFPLHFIALSVDYFCSRLQNDMAAAHSRMLPSIDISFHHVLPWLRLGKYQPSTAAFTILL